MVAAPSLSNMLRRVKVYSNEHPPWSKFNAVQSWSFEKHNVKHYANLRSEVHYKVAICRLDYGLEFGLNWRSAV